MKVISTLQATALVACFAAGPAAAQTIQWDMANEYAASSIHGQAQKVFTDAVDSHY